MKLVGVDTDETDVGGDKDSMEGGQPDSIDEYLEKTLDEDAAAAAAAADVKRRLEFESPSAVRVEESDGGSGEGNSAKAEGCACNVILKRLTKVPMLNVPIKEVLQNSYSFLGSNLLVTAQIKFKIHTLPAATWTTSA